MTTETTLQTIEEAIAEDLKNRFSGNWQNEQIDAFNYEYKVNGKVIFLTGGIVRESREDDQLYIDKITIFDRQTEDYDFGTKVQAHKIEDYFNN
jgi:hypothetical protein